VAGLTSEWQDERERQLVAALYAKGHTAMAVQLHNQLAANQHLPPEQRMQLLMALLNAGGYGELAALLQQHGCSASSSGSSSSFCCSSNRQPQAPHQALLLPVLVVIHPNWSSNIMMQQQMAGGASSLQQPSQLAMMSGLMGRCILCNVKHAQLHQLL